MTKTKAALYGLLGAFAAGALFYALQFSRPADSMPVSAASAEQSLEALRERGDMAAQRRHVWALLAAITKPSKNGRPGFETWHGEGELFGSPAPVHPHPGIAGFYRTDDGTAALEPHADVPVLTYTLYNEPAFQHIIRYRLNWAAGLERLRRTGPADAQVPGDRAVPAFPASSVVLKTVWWPVAPDGVTAMPVWDPDANPALKGGNPYTSWSRVVGVDPSGGGAATVAVDFAGASYPKARRVGLDAFYHVRVDAGMARRMMADRPTAKAMLIALGRPLQAGDYLALVGVNLATREIPEWIWAGFWWHDRPADGAFAAGRPETLRGAWRNYLMAAAFDTSRPAAMDGGAHIAFNPWLEGRFPDGGHGSGLSSNCQACHARASYPAVMFLPVTRGDPDLKADRAYAPGRLRTSFLWSLAMHAKTE